MPATRGEYEGHLVSIENARPFAENLALDMEGSTLVRCRSTVTDFFDETQILSRAHPETIELIKTFTGASRVEVFDHTVRRRSSYADYTPGVPRLPAN